jgi:hypothetical protein
MSKAVAVQGDTTLETSGETLEADSDGTGSWKLASSDVVVGRTLTCEGRHVELRASATWSYVGGASGGTPLVPVPDAADLPPARTLLTDNGDHILVDGDEAVGSVDAANRIVVSSSQSRLRTG